MFWERKDTKFPLIHQHPMKKLTALRTESEALARALAQFFANTLKSEHRNILNRLKWRSLKIKVHRRDHQAVKPLLKVINRNF